MHLWILRSYPLLIYHFAVFSKEKNSKATVDSLWCRFPFKITAYNNLVIILSNLPTFKHFLMFEILTVRSIWQKKKLEVGKRENEVCVHTVYRWHLLQYFFPQVKHEWQVARMHMSHLFSFKLPCWKSNKYWIQYIRNLLYQDCHGENICGC